MSEGVIDFLDYWNVLKKRKKIIVLVLVVSFVVSTVVSLLLPKTYSSSVYILPPQPELQVGNLISTQISQGGLGGLAGGILGNNTQADLWLGILKSEPIQDAIIERFKLKELYNKDYIEDARLALEKKVKIEKTKQDIIKLTVLDKSPESAANIANAYVEELDRINKNVVMTSGKRTRVFIGAKLKESEGELRRIEEQIKIFQEKHQAINIDDQSKAMIEAIGNVKGQLISKEVALETMLSYTTPNHPQAELLKREVDELKGKLRELGEGNSKGDRNSKDVFIPMSKIPNIANQYVSLLRDQKVQETLFQLLRQQYEMAGIQEAKDTPTVQILNLAKPAEKRTKPKRRMIILFSTLSAVFVSILYIFLLEYLERTRLEKISNI